MYDRSYTVALRAAGVVNLDLSLPRDAGHGIEVCAWESAFQASGGGAAFVDAAPVWIFEGLLDAAACAQRLASNPVDAVMVVPMGGVGRVKLSGDSGMLTVYTDNAPNDILGVTLRVSQLG